MHTAYIWRKVKTMTRQLPYWHPEADYSACDFFIRRMNTKGYIKPDSVPKAALPMTGFIYLTAGEVLVQADQRPWLCSAGHLMLIPEKMPFEILHYADAEGYSGGFSALLLPSGTAGKLSLLKHPLQQAFWFDDGIFVGELFNMLAYSQERGDRVFIEKGLDLLLSRIRTGPQEQMPPRVEAFLEMVFAPQAVPQPADSYARALGISTNYLERMVKKSTGRSIGAWTDIARIGRAKQLLKDRNMAVIDVAAAVGLEDQSYFARFFRRHTGLTPTAFRKQMQ